MTQFLIGTSGWNYSDWQGVFYPKDLPHDKWLEYYSSIFNAIEINATFYRFFKEETYVKWRDQVPAHFRFVLKVHRTITHNHRLKNCEDLITRFSDLADIFEEKLGLILLQLVPNMSYDLDVLQSALLAFPQPEKIAVEFRNEIWFTADVKKLLESVGAVFCSADSPEIHLKNWVTSDTAYIRLHGRKKWYDYNYSKKELEEIAALAKQMGKKAKKVYIFFNNDYYAYAVKNALKLREMLT